MIEAPDLLPDETALAARLLAAQAIAREAGQLALRYSAAPATLDVELKGPQDFVTAADRAAESLVRERLSEAFPEDAILGEEYPASGAPGSASVVWAVDPIDGTANFVAGRPEWCVSIGAIVGDRPELGVIYHPALDDLYAAQAGHGATRNGQPILVRPCMQLADATVSLEYSVGTDIDRYLGLLEPLLRTGGEYRRDGSAALALAQIAAGTLDGFIELHLNIWDVLAGIVLVREAGGWTSDFLAPGTLAAGNLMIAATPGIRDELLTVCNLRT